MIYMKDILINAQGVDPVSGELITTQRPIEAKPSAVL